MVKITFREHDGSETIVDARPGLSLMKNAVAANVPGILAECGGNCACGTCRIYFDPEWRALMGTPRESEVEMLDYWHEEGDGARLSCQVLAVEAMEGMVLRLPESQS
ncbi:MAG: 2Fe-2S iron-sulfur cluster binding domain-containing protein [Sphingomonadales bacterium]|nr:2Fe-2S iron-sulfur cluster binding domain-containing protein [Sphingomonadales bacterium]